MTAYEQRSYSGAAADTLLNADMASNALTFSVTPGTGSGYPDGSSGPFFLAVDYDNSKAEKIRCVSRVNDTFTIPDLASRGVDGTTAQAHSANAKVRAVWTATDAQEANRAAANTVGKVTSKGDLLAGSAANTLIRVAVGVNGAVLIANSGASGGVSWTDGSLDLTQLRITAGTSAVISLGDVGGTPPVPPANTGYLYSHLGALYYRGASGTVTMIAPA